ncbi:MAG TPA: DUF2784 domain-containing protein, partial [Nitrospirota bacterium]
MFYRILADITVSAHFLWILFLIFGGLWGRRIKAVKIAHVSGLVFAFFINLLGIYCPLTYLETWLRTMFAPATAYSGSFISHYLERVIYLNLPPYGIFALTVILCAFNVWVYYRRGK